jgi:hypothetical protein
MQSRQLTWKPHPLPPKKGSACERRKEKNVKSNYYQDNNIPLETMQESGNINENGKASTINNNKQKHKAHMQNAASCLLF